MRKLGGVRPKLLTALAVVVAALTAAAAVSAQDEPSGVDLTLQKTASVSDATVGDALSYTISVTNNSSTGATGVVVTDALPASVTFVSATASQGTCTGAPSLSCSLGMLGDGDDATITVDVVAKVAGSADNTASVSSNEADVNSGDNSATATVAVNAKPTPQPPKPKPKPKKPEKKKKTKKAKKPKKKKTETPTTASGLQVWRISYIGSGSFSRVITTSSRGVVNTYSDVAHFHWQDVYEIHQQAGPFQIWRKDWNAVAAAGSGDWSWSAGGCSGSGTLSLDKREPYANAHIEQRSGGDWLVDLTAGTYKTKVGSESKDPACPKTTDYWGPLFNNGAHLAARFALPKYMSLHRVIYHTASAKDIDLTLDPAHDLHPENYGWKATIKITRIS